MTCSGSVSCVHQQYLMPCMLCIQISPGGSMSNTMLALARLGAASKQRFGSGRMQAAFSAIAGSDPLGRFFLAQLQQASLTLLATPSPDSNTGTDACIMPIIETDHRFVPRRPGTLSGHQHCRVCCKWPFPIRKGPCPWKAMQGNCCNCWYRELMINMITRKSDMQHPKKSFCGSRTTWEASRSALSPEQR